MKKSLVYTRRGDDGSTELADGTRMPKDHARIEAYGTIDELNAHLGWLQTLLSDEADRQFVENVQHVLFGVGACLATPPEASARNPVGAPSQADVACIEAEIDRIDSLLPRLKAFLLPGGCQAAAAGHICRTICRRAERRILALSKTAPVAPELLAFVNRLSDYLFVLSRKLNIDKQTEEIFWKNGCR